MPFNSAFDDDSNPQNWFVSTPPAIASTAGAPTGTQFPTSPAPAIDPLATPPPGSWPGWSDPWQRYWSKFPASAANGQAWQPPIFLNSDPVAGDGSASNWPTTTSTLLGALSSSTPNVDPGPPWPPSQSLLGLIPYLGLTDSDPGTQGFFSIPALGSRLAPDPPVQSVADSNPSAPTPTVVPSGNPVSDPDGSTDPDQVTSPDPPTAALDPRSSQDNLLLRFFKAINPISTAQAAEGEGPPMSPQVARALAEALHDAAAEAELIGTRDALANYHKAMQDVLAYAGDVSSSKLLGKTA
jgi:hypothetical protein